MICLISTHARPQTPRGAVTGTVRDSSGAALSQASVTLVNAQQASLGVTETDAEGRFQFSGVLPGSYAVIA
ncbi:MAG: carboxypeptidase-like regulatory domain-containing protein, partial [Pyrinomonadaceae bacterium]